MKERLKWLSLDKTSILALESLYLSKISFPDKENAKKETGGVIMAFMGQKPILALGSRYLSEMSFFG